MSVDPDSELTYAISWPCSKGKVSHWWEGIQIILGESLWFECLWVREVLRVLLDCPYWNIHCCSLFDDNVRSGDTVIFRGDSVQERKNRV